MKEDIQNLLFEEIKSSKLKGITKASQIEVFEPKNIEFGDWTSNICMKLAANSEGSPRQIAEKLIQNLNKVDWITKIEIAGAGFLNFYLASEQKFLFIQECLKQKEPFLIKGKAKKKILIEYVWQTKGPDFSQEKLEDLTAQWNKKIESFRNKSSTCTFSYKQCS